MIHPRRILQLTDWIGYIVLEELKNQILYEFQNNSKV